MTGMEVKTTVGSNLLISTTNKDEDYTSKTLSQTRKALLEPTSTINGVTGTYYYTVNAKANGDAVVEEYTLYNESTSATNATAGKNGYDKAFNKAYKIGGADGTVSSVAMTDEADGAAYGYIDYTFYLKATSASDTSTSKKQYIRMTHCDLDVKGGASEKALNTSGTVVKKDGPDKAWRVAVFATSDGVPLGTGTVATDVAANVSNQKGLISLVGAANQADGKAVDSPTTATGTVLNNAKDDGVVIAEITTPGASSYYKVTVRVWLEGEDTTCTSETYAQLTEKYSLDLAFQLTDGASDDEDAVKNITSTGDPDDGWDATKGDGKTFEGNQYDVVAGS